MEESDFRTLFLDREARRWFDENIRAALAAWLHDDENADAWAIENYRYFNKFVLAFDGEARNDFLELLRNPEKRREILADDVSDDDFEREFLRYYFAQNRKRGARHSGRKAAALYFGFESDVSDWFQNVWLADSEWRYDPSRDDVPLAKIMADVNLRSKAPETVFAVFRWALPFCGSLTFLRARNRYDYYPESLFVDLYERLVGPDGRRDDAINGFDYYLRSRPCDTLKEWVELECARQIERVVARRRRLETGLRLVADFGYWGGKNAPLNDEDLTPPEAIQKLFDIFFAESPSSAYLTTAYLALPFGFNELSTLWDVDAKTLSKRFERGVERFRLLSEKALGVASIDAESWKRGFRLIKSDVRADDKEAKKKEREKPRFWELSGAPHPEWKKRVKFPTAPTEADEILLQRTLQRLRSDETGRYRPMIEPFWQERTQGGGVEPVCLVSEQDWRERRQKTNENKPEKPKTSAKTPPRPDSDEAREQAAGVPGRRIFNTELVRNYWSQKYATDSCVVFHWESKAPADSLLFWRASVRAPLHKTNSDAEVGVVIEGYERFKSAPVEFCIGNKSAKVQYGVAVFSLADFRAGIENEDGNLFATMKIRALKDEKRGGALCWHVLKTSAGRLLFRPPVVPPSGK